MACYPFQASHTGEACAAGLSAPQSCIEATRPVIGRLGGRLQCAYLAFGGDDVIGIMGMLDDVRAALLAASAEGGLKPVKATPLMTVEGGGEAMEKASGAGYRDRGGNAHSDTRTPQ